MNKFLDTTKIKISDAMAMNRKARRRLSKINGGLKIPGSSKPAVKEKIK